MAEKAEKTEKKKGSKLILMVVAVAVLGGGGFGVYKFVLPKFLGSKAKAEPAKEGGHEAAKPAEEAKHGEEAKPKEEAHKAEPAKEKDAGKEKGHGGGKEEKKGEKGKEGEKGGGDNEFLGAVMPLDTFIVNLAEATGDRYLKVTMQLKMSDAKSKEELEKRMPQVRNDIIEMLTSKTYAQVSNYGGKELLRRQISAKINSVLSNGKVLQIYFTEFMVQ
ncbi:MAG: flagellar basal body-associated FliL family protein [Deltaproteobacteria bacterium]|nr:flagellar basal body-associated FliL family protein [Deltaproteobacteria bacterium]